MAPPALGLIACIGALVALAQPIRAQTAFPVLDVNAVPYLRSPEAVSAYRDFLDSNLPRAFALSPAGRTGWQGGSGTLEQARQAALDSCAAANATTTTASDCAIYAEDLGVVWKGDRPPPAADPGRLIATGNYAFVADPRYFWWGPQAARGVYVWANVRGRTRTRTIAESSRPPMFAGSTMPGST